ncbi:MAG: glycoside hydrolase family 2 TIM barrel-domain containing protein [Bacilli bacterium]|nr:glycoside hydrolase family 2 TIM barrel-domain containing protein [Bacilli bacterium]
MKHTRCYRENYPRPQFVKNDWYDLCGKWHFVFDDNNCGEAKQYYQNFPQAQTINLPFSYQTEASGNSDRSLHQYLWYAREAVFDVAALSTNRLLLHFEGSDYITKVWVNGVFIGVNTGGYTRFSFDITSAVDKSTGKALIVVKAEDTLEATQPRGKQSWMGSPFGCWYQETSGIWKPVWAEFVPSTYLQSVKITPDINDYFVEFESALNQFQEGYYLRTEITFDGHLISDTTVKLTRRITNFKIDITNDFTPFRVHFWSPDNPQLYDIKFTLIKNDKAEEEVGSYFGFRSFRAERDLVILNNNPIYLRMVLFQGYHRDSGLTAPDEAALIRDIELAKALGFNGIRMHQKIEDERFYYYADILGMMVWVEMPSAYEFKDATIDAIVPEWMRVVKQHYNHPSAVCWVPMNESWGIPRVAFDPTNQHLAEALYNITKAYDRHRPVVTNDGWEHVVSDLITFHNYAQSPADLASFYDNIDWMLAGGNRVNYTQTRLPFAQGYRYQDQPIIISEFVGTGFENGHENKGWGYGDKVRSSEQYIERLNQLVKVVRSNERICGFCITQLTDVQIEINGLLDIDRVPKADIQVLKKAITQ